MGVFTAVEASEVRAFLRDHRVGDLDALRGIPAGSVNSNFEVTTKEAEGVGGEGIFPEEKAPRGRGRYFLRVYEEQGMEGAEREARLLGELATAGVPVAVPVLRNDGTALGLLRGKPAALFPWQEGTMRCQASVAPVDVARVGEALGVIHKAGASLPSELVVEGRFRPEDLRRRLAIIRRAPVAVLAAQADVLEAKLDHWESRRAKGLPQGLTHGDLFRDNVLFDPRGTLVALLDFESACRGVFAYDLMVTVLAWCFGAGLDRDLARALVAAYETVRPLTDDERAGLQAEGCLAALRFTITRITDYALREGVVGPRVVKDWRRFAARLEAFEAMGQEGAARL